MKKLTQEDALRLFRKHWQWCGKTGNSKAYCPPEELEGISIRNIRDSCFLCEYQATHQAHHYCHANCLIQWPLGSCGATGGGFGSSYIQWRKERNIKTKKILANEISKLPANPKYRGLRGL
jgi:hypothetical protein